MVDVGFNSRRADQRSTRFTGQRGGGPRTRRAASSPASRWSAAELSSEYQAACGVMMQVRGGKFVRLEPKQPGTLRCDLRNIKRIEADLLKAGSD